MPEFGTVQAGLARTIGAVPASTNGTTITGASSADTKGSWVELEASTEFDASWVLVSIYPGANVEFLVDIGIGAATEQIIIPDLFVFGRASNGATRSFLFPLFIPHSSRLSARCQSSVAGQSAGITITLFSGTGLSGGSGPSVVSAYGAVALSTGTNIDPGGTAHTDSSWVELTASTDRAHNWVVISVRNGDWAMTAGTRWLLDIGIGAATEQEVISDLLYSADTLSDSPFNGVICFPYFIPPGSRLTARVRSSSITDGDRDINIKIYGC